ncbi:phage major capsid protein [Marinobacter nauticus]|uniref:phage major capsid protein n=1 Tax=Marinobacter nauticus TaxID=2743 RepID=UPI001C99D218|nr:phage major capsid protein [Marinobacter nauticus]MBY5961721.1 phage major capsid protein [Marinobacter nauticus]
MSLEQTLTTEQKVAARKRFTPQLRSLGIKTLEGFEPHALTWNQLHERKKELAKLARTEFEKITDNTSAEEVREIETGFDALMAVHDAIVGELDTRGELGDRAPRSHGGDPRRPMYDNREVSARGMGGGDVEVSNVLRPEQRMADLVTRGPETEHLNGMSVGRYLRAMVTGAKNEAERRALAEGTDSAGGFTVPEILGSNLIDLMRANTVAMQAGAMTVPLTSDKNHIARLASDPVPAWRAENAAINESDPTFSRVTLEPKSLAVLVKVPRELLEDSLNIETELPRIMAAAMARELDRVVFLGSGSSSEPAGLDNISGVLVQAHDAGLSDYAPLVTARKSLMGQNVPRVSAYVMHPDTEAAFGVLSDSTGQPLNYPPILDRPEPMNWLTTTQLPVDLGTGSNETTIYAGDFSRLMIGVRSDVRIDVLKERYADNHQFGFIVHARYDVAAAHPEAFLRITGVQL